MLTARYNDWFGTNENAVMISFNGKMCNEMLLSGV